MSGKEGPVLLMEEEVRKLEKGLEKLTLTLDKNTQCCILRYMALLQKWNRTYNLTAIRDPQHMLTHHVLDALAVVPVLDQVFASMQTKKMAVLGKASAEPPRILDVGSGCGIPGLMLALARPAWQVTMVDAVQKKMAFVTQAITELKLPNAQASAARVEALRAETPKPETRRLGQIGAMRYDLIISRAFSDLAVFVEGSRHLLAPHGIWVAMKGVVPEAEIAALPPEVSVRAIEALTVPGLDASRHLILLEHAHGL